MLDPASRNPAEDGMIDVAVLELADSERPRPAALVRYVAQQPARFGMVRLALEDVAQSKSGMGIVRRSGRGSPFCQVEQFGRRLEANLQKLCGPGLGCPCPCRLPGPAAHTGQSPAPGTNNLGQGCH